MKRLFVAVTGNTAAWVSRLFWRLRCVRPSTPTSPPPQAASPNCPDPSASAPDSPVAKVPEWALSPRSVRRRRREGNLWHGSGRRCHRDLQQRDLPLRGAGKDPIKLTLAGQTAGLLVNGTVGGDYQLQGDQASFTVGESTGSATLQVGPVKKSLPISEVANVLAPDGEASLACANDALIVTLQDVRLELGKV